MKPLSLASVGITAALGGLMGAIVNAGLLASGEFPVMITPFLGAFSVLLALGLFLAGRKVRDLRDGKHSTLHPVMALRITLFARASALVCAGLVGVCAGIIVTNIPRLEAPAIIDSTMGAGIAAAGLAVWMGAGILVEKWGQRRDDDTPTSQPS